MFLIAAGLPAILCQDLGRYHAFARNMPKYALVSDLSWALAQAAALVAMWRLGHLTAPGLVLSWVLGGVGGAIVIVGLLRPNWVLLSPRVWLARTRTLSPWLGVQAIVTQGAGQLISVSIAGLAGLAALGGIRGVQLLFAPPAMLMVALSPLFLSTARQSVLTGASTIRGFMIRLTLGATGVALIYGAAMVIYSDSVLAALYHGNLTNFSGLAVPFGLGLVGLAASVAPGAMVRALHQGWAVLTTQLAASVVGLSAVPILCVAAGARGAAWGMAVESMVMCCFAWGTLAVAIRRRTSH
jgi:hypothetical protein